MMRTTTRRRILAAATVAAALTVCLAVVGDDWFQLGLDGWRSRTTLESLTPPLAAPRTAVGSDAYDASPVVADGTVLVAGRDGLVRAYGEADFLERWTYDAGDGVVATPAVGNGRVYVMSTDGRLHALRLANGQPIWSLSVGGTNRASPALINGTLYLCSSFPNRKLMALDPATGGTLWESPLDQVCDSSPAVAGGLALVATNAGTLTALNAATGAPVWTYSSGGAVKLASPLVDGSSIYLLPGGSDFRLHRVDVDPAQWASSNWTVALSDPAPPPPATIYGSTLATSSPVPAGGRVVVMARFDYALDLTLDGTIETYRMREFLIGVDPAARTVSWQVLTAARDVPDYNGIPLRNLCPTPAVSGGLVVAASSVDPLLEVRNAADGLLADSVALDGPSLASPTIANGRIYQATSTGRLQSWQGGNAPPSPPVANFAPSGGADVDPLTPALSWDPAADPDDAPATLTYVVRGDSDGEILEDWGFELTTAAGVATATAPALLDDTIYTWAVRTRDPSGASSAWSALQQFSVNLAPAPPGALTAAPGNQSVMLTWQPSSSPNVTDYLVSSGPPGGPFGPEIAVGTALTTVVSGLTNGTTYTFRVRARDAENDLSLFESVSAAPISLISIGGVDYGSLIEALDDALPGDTVVLSAGTFLLTGTLNVPAGVGLRGANARDTRLIAQDRFTLLRVNQPSLGAIPVVLEGLSLSGGSTGILTNGDAITLRNLVIHDMTDAGVEVEGDSTVTALHLTVFGAVNAGVRSSGTVSVWNSILDGNGRGLHALGGVFSSGHNAFHASTVAAYDGVAAGPGDVMIQPQYSDAPSGDFTLAAGSPTVDRGDPTHPFSQEPAPNGGRVNQGAFGNTPLAATTRPIPAKSGGKDGCFFSAAAIPVSARLPAVFVLAALFLLMAARKRSQRSITMR